MMKTIKNLPVKLRKNGFNYTQVLRGERSCIYEQMVCEEKDIKYYEVFLIRVRPQRTAFGKEFPAKERFPNDEAFGKWAWTFRSYEDAKWRFDELEAGKTRLEFTHRNSERKKYDL